ncbi:MAG: metalloendopeptidase [Citromicrobium sp.]|nr:metalloendopeptidase [Citromicrobium sp.]MAO97253.1 metalloendopeptidase [Citromicrobium sp.]MAS84502.1 metalloendopeptidase [Erythrobacteraceae bacterium]MBD75596.1 metalloendopeptidase [Citromicrobium sp.]MBT45706.1 metalloendopeptidase [Citromicrobium sp.]|tara:strand:+ start:2866 stop:4104 length:1239 start_codon:yes stop_codon:yes gene_type:complete
MVQRFALLLAPLAVLAAVALAPQVRSQQGLGAFETTDEVRAAIQRAERASQQAAKRGRSLEAAAAQAKVEADKIASQSAALAARIQETEAEIAVAKGQLTLIRRQQDALNARLGERREPLIRLTGALQNFSRRPLVLSVFRPGSIRESMYLRAVLETTIPQVRGRTAALRSEIDRSRGLRRKAETVLTGLAEEEERLATRRSQLAAIETRKRLAARRRGGEADRQEERALAYAEQARDLDGLVARIDAAGTLREELAELPGPLIRPAQPAQARAPGNAQRLPPATKQAAQPPAGLRLPVDGRTLRGFGSVDSSGGRSEGVTIRAAGGAQVVTPAPGRVAFAGPFRGYDRIVIIEHPDGWTSLITGLARTDVGVGDELVEGAPLGVAPPRGGPVGFELRLGGRPANPLDHLGR